jgi:hypothetical protein
MPRFTRLISTLVLAVLSFSISAKVIQVLPGHNTMQPALAQLVNGDTLVLVDGTYTVDSTPTLTVSATIRSISPGVRPRLVMTNGSGGSALTVSSTSTLAIIQGIDFVTHPLTNGAISGLSSSAVTLRLIDTRISDFLSVNTGSSVIVGNDLPGRTTVFGSHTVFAGNTIIGTGASIRSTISYIIGNRFACTSRVLANGTNQKPCTLLSVGSDVNYVVANRFEHDVDGLLSFVEGDTIRALNVTGTNRHIYNNLFDFKGGGMYFTAAGIVQAINTTGTSGINDIANNLVVFSGSMPAPSKVESSAINLVGVGRATNNMVVDFAGLALSSNNDLIEYVYNLCSGVGDLGKCTPDNNNVSTAPQFAETTNYTLAAGSPAVNGGDPGLHLSDLDGTRSDIGLHGGRFGFLQYDLQRADSGKPYLYPLFDEVNLTNLNEVVVKAISIARFK